MSPSPQQKLTPGGKAPPGVSFCILFNGHNVIVHRLPTGQHADLCVGTGVGKDGLCFPGVLLRHILAVEDRHKLGVSGLGVLRQLCQQRFNAAVGAEELSVLQGQIVPLVDGEAVTGGLFPRTSCNAFVGATLAATRRTRTL